MNPAPGDIIRQNYTALVNEADRRRKIFNETPAPKIHIGMATCGIASGALETRAAFQEALAARNIEARIHTVGCVGHCYAEPVVVIDHPASGFPPIFYHKVTPGKARMLTKLFLEEGDPRFEHVLGAVEPNELIPSVAEFARFNREKRVVMEKCGKIDPEDIYEYIAEGGYGGLVEALGQSAEAVIDTIARSGLRGRGGAGFATGRKRTPRWSSETPTRAIPAPIWTAPF
jgi:NADH-quinone oxidoreductase subunit F